MNRPPPSVLLVDDDDSVRGAMAENLRRRGCRVETAPDGVAALELLERTSFDAIISDVDMPRMDGLTLLGRVLHRDPTFRTRFLLCSGGKPVWRRTVPDIAFLPKPFTGAELWGRLQELLAPSPDP